MNTVLITGCSSGIGKATALLFAAQGWNVSATVLYADFPAREEMEKHPNIFISCLDVTKPASISSAIDSTIAHFGSLDVVVNNAGILACGPFEFATQECIEKIYNTNALGPLYVTQAALPHFRKQKKGMFVNISSVVGRVAMPFMSLYIATKNSVEGMSEALNLELVPLGIRVKIVEPGHTTSDIGANAVTTTSSDVKDYDAMMDTFSALFSFGVGGEPAESVTKAVWTAATDGTKQVRYVVGKDAEDLIANRAKVTAEEHEESAMNEFWFSNMASKVS